jgi:hypothetical protein
VINRTDVPLLSAVLVAQLALAIALRVARVPWLCRLVARSRGTARLVVSAPEQRIAWAIEGVGRRLPGISTCLVRALAADLFLSGVEPRGQVTIGVRRSASGTLESHAWFEREGRVLVGGDGVHHYVDFVTLDTVIADRT